MRREKANYVIQSVSHALDVLEEFSGDNEELGVTELSKRLKLHKNNVFRVLATLEARGYIEQNRSTENYRLGARCLRLGQRFLRQQGFLRAARPVLERLCSASGETAILAVLRGDGVVPLLAIETDRPVRLVFRVGEMLPLQDTAFGQALQGPGDLGPGPATEEGSGASVGSLAEGMGSRPAGVMVEIGQRIPDGASVAAPVRDYTGTVVASLGVAGPAYRLTADRLEGEILTLVAEAARELSTRLGFDPLR